MRLSLHSDLPTADPYLPGHGDRSWSAAHYALDLDYDLAGNRLRAEAVIDAIAEEDLSRVVLDLAGLDVTKVTVDGQAPAKYAARSNRVVLTLRAPVTRGTSFRMVVKYAGAPKPLIDKHHGDAGWEELDDGVIVAGQPHGAPTWFPCNDRPDDKASYSITVTAAADYTVVANGELAEKRRGVVDRHLALRAGRADGDLPGHRPDRALRAAALRQAPRFRWPRRCPADVGPGFEAAFGRQPEMMARFVELVRPVPVRALHVGGHRRRPRDPAGVPGPVDVRPELLPRRLGRDPAGRPRAGPPVVRQRPDARALAGHLAARGVRLLLRVAVVGGLRRRLADAWATASP